MNLSNRNTFTGFDRLICNGQVKPLLYDVIIYGFSKILPGLATIISVVVFVRLVGVEQYGHYALLLSAALSVRALTISWLNQSQLRYRSLCIEDIAGYNSVVLFTLRRMLLVAIAIALLSYSFAIITHNSFLVDIALGSVFVGALMWHSVGTSSHRASLNPARYAKMEGIRSILFIVIPVTLVFLWQPTYAVLIVGVTTAYALSQVTARTARALQPVRVLDNVERSVLIRRFWDYGWPMSIWLGLSMLFPVSDRYLLQHFISFEATGAYATMYDIVIRAYSLLFFPVTMAVHPRAMDAWDRGSKKQVLSMLAAGSGLLVLIYVAVCLTLMFAGIDLMRLVAPEVAPSATVTILLTLATAGFVWQLALIVHKPLEMRHRTSAMLYAIAVAFVSGLVLNTLLIPRIGLLGPAVAYLVAGLIYVGSALFMARGLLDVSANAEGILS